MSDLTVRELKRDASRVKREIDTLEKAAYGMTFEELLRLLAGGATGKHGEGNRGILR